jgi:hypothetical protein
MSDRESFMSEAQRKGILKADPRVIEVRAHEVLCRGCSQWVQLHSVRPFDHQRWRVHCESCSEIQYVDVMHDLPPYSHKLIDRVIEWQRLNAD